MNKSKEGLQRRFKCKWCDNNYASPSGRRRHEKTTHLSSDASANDTFVQDTQIAGNS